MSQQNVIFKGIVSGATCLEESNQLIRQPAPGKSLALPQLLI